MNLPGFNAENSLGRTISYQFLPHGGQGAGIRPQKVTLPFCPPGEEWQCKVCGHRPNPFGGPPLPLYCCNCGPNLPQLTLTYNNDDPNCQGPGCVGTLTIEGQYFSIGGGVGLNVSNCGPDGLLQFTNTDGNGSFSYPYYPCTCGGSPAVQATDFGTGKVANASIKAPCPQ